MGLCRILRKEILKNNGANATHKNMPLVLGNSFTYLQVNTSNVDWVSEHLEHPSEFKGLTLIVCPYIKDNSCCCNSNNLSP